MTSSKVILDLGDISDLDFCVPYPLFKLAGSLKGYDVICLCNYPVHLSYFDNLLDNLSHSDNGKDLTGFKFGLRQLIKGKYDIDIPNQFMDMEILRELFLKNEFTKDLIDIFEKFTDDNGKVDVLHVYRKIYFSLNKKILKSVWESSIIPESYKEYTSKLYVCEGGNHDNNAFQIKDKFFVLRDEVFTYRNIIPHDIENWEADEYPYDISECYVSLNGAFPSYNFELLKNVDIKGVYAMMGVESSESPLTLFAEDVTSRVPFAGMNIFYSPERTVSFLEDMGKRNVPIHIATNNEVNRSLVFTKTQFWKFFCKFFDNQSDSFKVIEKAFNAYYVNENGNKLFDLLSGLHLFKNIVTESGSVLDTVSTACCFLDKKFGISITGSIDEDEETIKEYMLYHASNHKNKSGVEDWRNVVDALFDSNTNSNTLKTNLIKINVSSLTRAYRDKIDMIINNDNIHTYLSLTDLVNIIKN